MTSPTETNCFSLPVSFIRQFCFCRRIPYLQLGMGINPPKAGWVQKGVEDPIQIERLMKRRRLSRLGMEGDCSLVQEVMLRSDKLDLHGVCDGYIRASGSERIIPFEIKSNESTSAGQGEILQLCAYAMLLEERLGVSVDVGFLLYGKKSKALEIKISDELRRQVRTIAEQVESDIRKGLMPPTSATEAKCFQCEFLNFCADRF